MNEQFMLEHNNDSMNVPSKLRCHLVKCVLYYTRLLQIVSNFNLKILFIKYVYSNEYGSAMLFQCRTYTLKLRWRQGFEGGAVDCLLCGGGEETMRHFVTDCCELQVIRRQYGVYGAEALEEVLMFREKSEERVNRCKKMLRMRMRRI